MSAELAEVNEFCRDLFRTKDQLWEAQQEIARLKKQLRVAKGPKVPTAPLSSIRRAIASYCHPDHRGGDLTLMQHVNALFDYLERRRAAEST